MSPKMISIVVPIQNEELCIKEFLSRLKKVLKKIKYENEIIFVDDGSDDNSLKILEKEFQSGSNIKIISFTRNFGHQSALLAGYDFAQGDCVITMDADLQHPPELINEMVVKWEEGYDIVFTIRKKTEGCSIIKRLTSALYYKILDTIGEIHINPAVADFRLLDRRVVDHLKELNERYKFIRGLVSWLGYKSYGLEYTAKKRFAGDTKYSMKKMILFSLDGITSFSISPLRVSSLLGGVVSILSFIYLIFVLFVHFFTNRTIPGWSSIILCILFLGGIQLLAIGVLGEYIGRIYIELKRRPTYIIDKKIGYD
jgi:dolichol-phosphate mannosyltransferase